MPESILTDRQSQTDRQIDRQRQRVKQGLIDTQTKGRQTDRQIRQKERLTKTETGNQTYGEKQKEKNIFCISEQVFFLLKQQQKNLTKQTDVNSDKNHSSLEGLRYGYF